MRRIGDQLSLPINIVRGIYKRRGLQAHGVGMQTRLEESDGFSPANEDGDDASEAQLDKQVTDEGVTSEEASGEGPEESVERPGSEVELWDGLLTPEYETAPRVANAGVLLALPIMRRLKVLETLSAIYSSLGLLSFYGLQCFINLMVFLALLRIKRPEDLKSGCPETLGRSLGLPRVPEVKTVRRKLARLAAQGQARQAMLGLAKVRLEHEKDLLGFLYVDGHLRPYSGKANVAKGYSMIKHRPVRATTDTWANDRHGSPLFLVTSEINEGLTKALDPVLEQARELVGADRPITVVFDRGGFSAELFVRLIDAGFDIITYRKGSKPGLPESDFAEHVYACEGEAVTYWLHDNPSARVGDKDVEWSDGTKGPLMMREVTRLKKTGQQTRVLTTRADLEPQEVLWRLFARWRQENFFKYMRQEFAIDGLVEYGWHDVDPSQDRPNPEYQALTQEIKQASAAITKLQSQRCELLGEPSPEPMFIGSFERFVPCHHAAQELMTKIRTHKNHLQELEAQRAEVPRRISAGDLSCLLTERQQVATLFKVIAYNIETELFHLVAQSYRRAEREGRKLIAGALRSSADLEVTPTELRVTLAAQSSPHRSRAIAELCANLNKLETIVPGTSLRLVLDCAV
jgi:hypothetical protein